MQEPAAKVSEKVAATQADTRTFPEIWKGLTRLQKETLRYALIKNKVCTTRQSVNNWANDRKRPSLPLVRKEVARVVSSVIGSRVFGDTLFPPRDVR